MTTTAPVTAPAAGHGGDPDAGHVDVLIVGAGVSGIGAAHHLRDQFPDRTFVILDAQDNRGGTWWTHRYPGVRSDSDLFTYGYRFKPWRGPRSRRARRSSPTSTRSSTRTTSASTSATGTGSRRPAGPPRTAGGPSRSPRRDRAAAAVHRRVPVDVPGLLQPRPPYRPQWEGMERFQGEIVHPQQWPEDLDLTGKRVVVIGSGATAATLIPAIADEAEHVRCCSAHRRTSSPGPPRTSSR